MTRIRFSLTAFALVGGAFVLLGAGGPETKKPKFEKSEIGLTVAGGVDGSHKRESHADGRVAISEKATVEIQGKGSRTLSAELLDEPIAAGGKQAATITDPENGKSVSYTYTPANNSIAIAEGSNRVVIVQNADKSYAVNGTAAGSGKAAVALLKGNDAWEGASAHSVMLAYSYSRRPNAAARSDGEFSGGVSTPRAVCDIFEDFCECAVCDKAGKGSACSGCK